MDDIEIDLIYPRANRLLIIMRLLWKVGYLYHILIEKKSSMIKEID